MRLPITLTAMVVAAGPLLVVATDAAAQRRGGVHCVTERGSRICRMNATAKERRHYAKPMKSIGKTQMKSVTRCRPGTRPDGKWYLVKCTQSPSGLCKSRCTVSGRV
jgi:hypothetical protein